MQPRLVLASGSRYKEQLLGRLGLPFQTCPAHHVDERAEAGETPQHTAQRLATAKAQAVRGDHPGSWVLGADQVIALEGRRFSKPGTKANARHQLRELSGRTHRLITAVTVIAPAGDLYGEMADYQMEMRTLRDAEIRAYVDEDRPVDCAGSYKIEAGGIRLFRRLSGDDYTAIVGLPLTVVWRLLERADYFSTGESSRPQAGGQDDHDSL